MLATPFCFSLSIFIQSDLISDAKLAVGLMLLVAASMRLIPALNKWMIAAVQRQIRLYHLVMGILHGATNLGGAMLAILAGATQDEKAQIRFTVSFYYLGFAIIQCSTLIISGNGVGLLNGVLFAPIAVVVFFIAGNPIFSQLRKQPISRGSHIFHLLIRPCLVCYFQNSMKSLGFNHMFINVFLIWI